MPSNRKPWIFYKLPGICCLSVLLFASTSAPAQTRVYPVSVTTQLAPPYSVNLADYAAPGTDQLRVIIVQRDLTQAPYRLYLRMEIRLNGRTIIRTSQEYFPPALTLDPGIPTVISGSDLSSFFDPENMEFTGYSRENYIRTKLLPEGAYVITFTAYDFARRDVALSHGGDFFCYLAKSEPPLLNLPSNNSLVPFTSPQQINFQWLPRTVTSPNSAGSTKYRLEIFEIRTGGLSPNEVVNSSSPVFSSETDRNSYSYSIADPLLEKGLRYAWRIKAFDTGGRDYIRNDGYSEVFSFIYGEEGRTTTYNSIENFQAQAVSSRKARLTWDISPEYDSYKVFYRKQGSGNRWYESETSDGATEITGLSPGLIYECRVQGKSSGIWGDPSDTDTVLMPVPRAIECGSSFMQPAITNRNPLMELMRLQEFDADGFMVTVTDPYAITTKPGIFSGRGFVQVPLFGHKKIRCVFTDVFINTDYQMVEGIVRLLSDNTPGGDNALWDIDEVFEGGASNGSVLQGTEEANVIIPDIVIKKPESIILDTTHGEITVITGNNDTARIDIGNQLEIKPATLTVKDSEGNLYSVNTENGKSTFVGQAATNNNNQQTAALPQIIDDRKGIVKFGPAEDSRFAFDKKDSKYRKANLFNEEYETIKLYDGSEYDVPLKLIPVGETDKVLATIEKKGRSVSEDSIVFRSGTGTIFQVQPSGRKSQYVLTLPSGKDNDGIDIYAVYSSKGQTFVLGKMKVISYQMSKPKLVLVPVNGNDGGIDIASVKRELDNVYKPVAVDWQVSMDQSDFRYTSDSLNINGSGMWSRYTDGMKRLNSEFMMHKKAEFDASAIYLFLLKSSEDPQATGDMPRSVQFGYIFTEKSGNDKALYRTVAHETAHGMFHLSHTFDNQYQIAKGSTDNLLDYTAGTSLVKHQWDAIHAPGMVLGMFERDEDGAMKIPITKFIEYSDLGIDLTRYTCDIPNKLTFISPGGYPIVLPKNYKFCFSGITSKNEIDNTVPLGVLTAFKDEGNNTYVSTFIKSNGTWNFRGYTKKNSDQEKFHFAVNEINSLPNPAKVVIGIENELNCKIDIAFINYSSNYKNLDLSKAYSVNTSFNYSEHQPSIVASYEIETCRLPARISSLTKANCSELFASEVWVKYNIYGDGGVLLKYNIDGADYYVYSNLDASGKSYYYSFDEREGKWRNYVPPKIEGVLNSLSFLINPQVLGKAAKDEGHTALDIMGMIPVAGEAFDALNGVIYLFEKENGQAALCFSSTLPIAGWVTAGGKYIWKGARKYANILKTASGFELLKISDDAIEKITAKINDLKLESKSAESLANDLQSNPELLQKLADIPELIESWDILSAHPVLRKNPGNLEVLNKVKTKFTYNGKQGKEALKEILDGHVSVQKLIDNFGKAEEIFDGVGIKHWSAVKSSGEVRLVNDAGEIIGKVEEGKFIVTAAPGSRPKNVETYLLQTYINDHLEKFKKEVSTLTFENSINTYGQIGRDDGLFVLPKEVMDEMLANTKGDVNLIEKELGIPLGSWSKRINDPLVPDKLVRVDINSSTVHNLRMSTGNEAGANILWIPGGKTPEGHLEAVVDPIPASMTKSYTKTFIKK